MKKKIKYSIVRLEFVFFYEIVDQKCLSEDIDDNIKQSELSLCLALIRIYVHI